MGPERHLGYFAETAVRDIIMSHGKAKNEY